MDVGIGLIIFGTGWGFGANIMTEQMIANHITEPVMVWQYKGQLSSSWPSWVKKCCLIINDTFIHDKDTGRQALYENEWLVKNLDGEVIYYSDVKFRKEYEINDKYI